MTDAERLEILKQAMYHIKDYQDCVSRGNGRSSPTWNIANNALREAWLRTETDNEVKQK